MQTYYFKNASFATTQNLLSLIGWAINLLTSSESFEYNYFLCADIWRSGGTAPTFLIAAIDGGEWSASCPATLPPGRNSPRYPLNRRLGVPQTRSGHCRVEENKFLLLGIEPQIFCRPTYSPSLYCLSYLDVPYE
jgi:hypothetical protein